MQLQPPLSRYYRSVCLDSRPSSITYQHTSPLPQSRGTPFLPPSLFIRSASLSCNIRMEMMDRQSIWKCNTSVSAHCAVETWASLVLIWESPRPRSNESPWKCPRSRSALMPPSACRLAADRTSAGECAAIISGVLFLLVDNLLRLTGACSPLLCGINTKMHQAIQRLCFQFAEHQPRRGCQKSLRVGGAGPMKSY